MGKKKKTLTKSSSSLKFLFVPTKQTTNIKTVETDSNNNLRSISPPAKKISPVKRVFKSSQMIKPVVYKAPKPTS